MNYNGRDVLEKQLMNKIRLLFINDIIMNQSVNYEMIKCGRNVHKSLKALSKKCNLLDYFKSSNDEQALNKYLNILTENIKKASDIESSLLVFKYNANREKLKNFFTLHLAVYEATKYLESIEAQLSDDKYESKCQALDVLEKKFRESEMILYRSLLDLNNITPISIYKHKIEELKEII